MSNYLYSQLLCQLFLHCTSIFQCAGYVVVSEVISSWAHLVTSPSRESQSVRKWRQEKVWHRKAGRKGSEKTFVFYLSSMQPVTHQSRRWISPFYGTTRISLESKFLNLTRFQFQNCYEKISWRWQQACLPAVWTRRGVCSSSNLGFISTRNWPGSWAATATCRLSPDLRSTRRNLKNLKWVEISIASLELRIKLATRLL